RAPGSARVQADPYGSAKSMSGSQRGCVAGSFNQRIPKKICSARDFKRCLPKTRSGWTIDFVLPTAFAISLLPLQKKDIVFRSSFLSCCGAKQRRPSQSLPRHEEDL
ncbi:MAG: hypothetical protein AB3N11_06600, partial [Arenibacterium sp.]